ncbi:MAG: hypothetical protein WC003_07195 [Terrimicrobiaceae bacterium]
MIETFEQLQGWMKSSENARVQDVLNWFPDYFRTVPFPKSQVFVNIFREHRDEFENIFRGETSLCKSVVEFRVQVEMAASRYAPNADDSALLGNASMLLFLLILGAERQKAPEWLMQNVVESCESLFTAYLATVVDQMDTVCAFLLEIKTSLARLALANPRIVLIDLPVGNTIPVLLLNDLLQSLGKTEIIRISLPRNTSPKNGLTRKALLTEYIREANIRPNDIVIYLDEWNTGSNFKAICELLKKTLSEGSFLLPLALLTKIASTHDRYESMCGYHDKLMERWGHTFQRARITLPRIRTCLPIETYFFWAEHDRLAGLRKSQIYGAIFSSYDAAIEMLRGDEEKLKIAISILLAVIRKDETPPQDVGISAGTLRDLFYEGYDDYQNCRDEARNCAAEFDKGGETDDFSEELEAVTRLNDAVIGNRPAKWAHLIAHYYLQQLGSIDPADRYYFESHAATLVPLKGRMALPHEWTMEFFHDRMEQIQGATPALS